MRFVLHGSGSLPGVQIDWDVSVELGPEVRAAMAPRDVDQMQAGIVQRGYLAKRILYPRGTIALRISHGHEIFLAVPADAVKPVVAKAAVVATTVEHGEAGDRHRIAVGDDQDGERVDVIIAATVETLSRAVAQRLIDEGHVSVGGTVVAKANLRLHTGDVIELVVPERPRAAHQPNAARSK